MIYPTKVVYLAGPISGLAYRDARYGWRGEFASLLPEHILPASPMRAKEFLDTKQRLDSDPQAYSKHPLARPAGILARDRNDVRTCDAMVACFFGTAIVSIGTCIEFGWADAYRKPIVVVIEGEQNIHWHTMLYGLTSYCVPTLEEAAHAIEHLLTPRL